jgi:hypothetical protein
MTRLRSRELPKLYYPTPDELQGATPLWEGGWGYRDNTGSWFDVYQPLLLRLVNTDYGRDLLCIDSKSQMPYPIIRIRKNMVTYYRGRWGDGYHYISDVRVGAKWGNVIRYRWLEVKKALDRMNLEYILSLPKYILRDGREVALPRGATETIKYPDAHGEETSVDGDAMHANPGGTWQNIHDGAGTHYTDSDTTMECRLIEDPGSTYESNIRIIVCYDASDISSSDILDSAVMSLYGNSVSNDSSLSPTFNIYTSAPADTVSVEAGDYNSFGTTALSTAIAVGSINTGGYNAFNLNSDGLEAVSFTAVSELGCVEAVYDVANNPPTWAANGNQTRFTSWAADNSGTSKDPKLVIQHTSTFTPKAIMF